MLKVQNGLVLSKMLLCQHCGLDINTDLTLADETLEDVIVSDSNFSYTEDEIMENRPLLLRTCITVFVIALFIIGMYPLRERDYYQVFMEMLKNPGDKEAAALVEDAKKLKEANPQLFQSQVLLQAAENRKIDLTKKVKGDGLLDNRDVMSLILKNASGSIRLGLDLAGGVGHRPLKCLFAFQLEPGFHVMRRQFRSPQS